MEEKQVQLRCWLLGIDFITPARLLTFLNGITDPLQ